MTAPRTLPSEDRARLKVHIEGCGVCRVFLERTNAGRAGDVTAEVGMPCDMGLQLLTASCVTRCELCGAREVAVFAVFGNVGINVCAGCAATHRSPSWQWIPAAS